MGEFELIRQFFTRPQAEQPEAGVVLGIGDDCALLTIEAGKQLAISVDTAVSGVHFPAEAPAELIAQRTLCSSLSDLAAMGAEPKWFTLALTLPEVDEQWLRDFSRGLFAIAQKYQCHLVGGDTTRGPLAISLQVMGEVVASQTLRRDGAAPGDFVLVTHCLGDGAAGLAVIENRLSLSDAHNQYLHDRFYIPTPRFAEARLIREIASAALDISDGLIADLGHICQASDVGAVIDVDTLPLSEALRTLLDADQARAWALSGGDDYELCFTVAPAHLPQVAMLIAEGKLQATIIGNIVAGSGVHLEQDEQPYQFSATGYQHFSS